MANLHFHYGVMSSSKSAALIINAHNFTQNQNPTEVIKPSFDNRFASDKIVSRIGLNWDESNLEFTMVTKREDSVFKLQGSTTGLLNRLPQNATVQASQLRNLLQSFAGNNTVLVTIGSKALFIQSDTYTGVLRYS